MISTVLNVKTKKPASIKLEKFTSVTPAESRRPFALAPHFIKVAYLCLSGTGQFF